MAGEVEVRSLLLKVDASVELLRKNLSDAGTQLDTFTRKGENAAVRFDNSMKRVNASSGQMRAGFQQLSFQVSDVASQLGAGTSALQVFSQQSGQVIQAIGLMTGEAKGFIGFLGGPWGLILTSAVTLLLRFTSTSHDAAKGQKEIATEAKTTVSSAQATLAGLGSAFDPFISGIGRALHALSGLGAYTTGEFRREVRSTLGYIDTLGRASNAITPFLPGSLGSSPRAPTDLVANFDKGVAANEAAQRRRIALDATDQRYADILGRLGFTRTRSIGGYIGDLPTPRATRGRASGGGRAAAPAADPFASIVQDAYDAVNGIRFGSLDPNKEAADASRKFFGSLGLNPSQDFKNIVEEIDKRKQAEFEVNQQVAADELQKRTENIRTLAGLYTDAFQGGTKAIFRDFKQLGLQVIAELLARFTLAQIGGQKFNFGSALGSALAATGFGGFRAAGGPVGAGTPYVVGERGPELFVPKVPGNIIPNGRGAGGQSVAVTINAPGATAETVSLIRREVMNAVPVIVQASQKTTVSALQRPRL